MRSLVIFCTLLIVAGASVARYADKVLVNSDTKRHSYGYDAATTKSSSSSVTVVSAPPAPTALSSDSAASAKPSLPEIVRMPSTSRSVILQGDRHGQFRVDARVDARRLAFIVDTGAGSVALRASAAAQLGIHPTERDYTVKTQTANGVGRAAPIRIDMIEIDNIVVRDVRAIVVPDDALEENLLGMSFLSRVRWTHDRGRLLLEQ